MFTIVTENHSRDQIFGNTAAAPYINGLAAQNAVAAGYHDSYVHPSEPNYLWMVAGENFGILNDDDETGVVSQVPYDTSSFLKTVEGMLGLEPLPCAMQPETVQTMDDLFTTPVVAATTPAGTN